MQNQVIFDTQMKTNLFDVIFIFWGKMQAYVRSIFLLVDIFPSCSRIQASRRWLHSKADEGTVII